MKNYLDFIVINFIFLLVGIGLFFMAGERIEILGGKNATHSNDYSFPLCDVS